MSIGVSLPPPQSSVSFEPATPHAKVSNLFHAPFFNQSSPPPSPSQVLYDQPTGRLALVFELMDMNIYELIRGRRQQLPEPRIKAKKHTKHFGHE